MLIPEAVGVIAISVVLCFVLLRLAHLHLVRETPGGARIPGLNGLRALAATSILALHTTNSSDLGPQHNLGALQGLRTGVALFFVISGMLMFRPFVDALAGARQKVSLRGYAVGRVFRILPLFAAANLVAYLASVQDPLRHLEVFLRATFFLGPRLLPVAWSLDFEAKYYLLPPLLYVVVLLVVPLRRRFAALVALTIALSLASAALDAWIRSRGVDPGGLGAAAQFHLFGAGMLLAMLASRRPDRIPGQTAALVMAGGLVLVAYGYWQDVAGGPFSNLALGVGFAMVVGTVVLGPAGWWARRPLTVPLMWLLGEASYGIYLWHELVQHALFNARLLSPLVPIATAELLAATTVLAIGSYLLIERPSLVVAVRIRSRLRSRRAPAALLPSGRQPAEAWVGR